MAFHDWNHDGKKDFTDDFIEYQIYKQSTSNSNYTPRNGGGISTFGIIEAIEYKYKDFADDGVSGGGNG